MAKSLIPKSKAKTAFGLLSEIAALAIEEPMRMTMNNWYLRPGAWKEPRRGFPACNTVGCVGGWTETLVPNAGADRTLGLSQAQEVELFYPRLLMKDGIAHGQTLAHARKVVAHIRRFQKKYRGQLLSTRIS